MVSVRRSLMIVLAVFYIKASSQTNNNSDPMSYSSINSINISIWHGAGAEEFTFKVNSDSITVENSYGVKLFMYDKDTINRVYKYINLFYISKTLAIEKAIHGPSPEGHWSSIAVNVYSEEKSIRVSKKTVLKANIEFDPEYFKFMNLMLDIAKKDRPVDGRE